MSRLAVHSHWMALDPSKLAKQIHRIFKSNIDGYREEILVDSHNVILRQPTRRLVYNQFEYGIRRTVNDLIWHVHWTR